jgi:hypothetical protein
MQHTKFNLQVLREDTSVIQYNTLFLTILISGTDFTRCVHQIILVITKISLNQIVVEKNL